MIDNKLGVVILSSVDMAPSLLESALAAAHLSAEDPRLDVTVISHRQLEVLNGATAIALEATTQSRLDAASKISRSLSTSMLGRNLSRFTMFDPNARFWRAVRRNPEAKATITSCSILIAADRNTTLAAWKLARARGANFAFVGLTAGLSRVRAALAAPDSRLH